MLQNKYLLFGVMGFLGGVAGSLASELLPRWQLHSALLLIGWTAVWGAVFATGILIGLTWALEIYSGRKQPSMTTFKNALASGLIAGAIASGIAQAVFAVYKFAGYGQFIFQSGCWGLTGAILGWRLSRSIPNLGALRGATAGLIGGWVGGMGFLLVSRGFDEVIGRLLGVGILGAALGLAIVLVEALFREASLEVIWAPREVTLLSLGPTPISIGGGGDHIHVSGLPPHAATIVLERGKIYYANKKSGQTAELHDGSRIKVEKIEMVVHAKG